MRETDLRVVARRFGELAEVMHEIADHLDADLDAHGRLAG